jgi:hypothetical protein
MATMKAAIMALGMKSKAFPCCSRLEKFVTDGRLFRIVI